MRNQLENVIFELSVKTLKATKKINKFEEDVKISTKKLERRLGLSEGRIEKFTRTTATGLAALGTALGAGALLAANYSDSISRIADRTGASASGVQALRREVQRFKLDADIADDALQDLNERLGEFKNEGTGEAGVALGILAKNQEDLNNLISGPTDEVFIKLIERMSQLEDVSKQSALAAQLFGGEAGPKMAGLISEGSKALVDQKTRLDEMGYGDVVADAARANRALKELKEDSVEGLTVALAQLAPFIETTSKNLKGFLELVRQSKRSSSDLLTGDLELNKQFVAITAEIKELEKKLASTQRGGNARRIQQQQRLNDLKAEQLRLVDAIKESAEAEYRAQESLNKAIEDAPPPPDGFGGVLKEEAKEQREVVKANEEKLKLFRLQQELKIAEIKGEVELAELIEGQISLIQTRQELENLGLPTAEARQEAEQAILDIIKAQNEEKGAGGGSGGAGEPDGGTDTSEMQRRKEEFRDSFKDGVKAAIEGDLDEYLKDKLRESASDMFDDALDNLADALFQMLNKGGQSGGGILGAIVSGIGGVFGGGKAIGGPVSSNKSYLVGENGPELFVPNASGVIDNNPSGGGVNVTVNNNAGVSVQTNADSNGNIDITLEAVAAAINRGGNSVASAMEKSYGISRGGF